MRAAMLRAFLLAALVASVAPRPVFATTADDICAPSADPCVVSTDVTVAPGSTLDFGTRQLDVKPGAGLMVQSGQMTISAGSVRLETNGDLIGGDDAMGNGATIKVTTSGDIRIETGASGDAMIDVSANNNAGEIDLVAHGNIVIAGQMGADAPSNPGSGGVINVTADGSVSVSGTISAKGGPIGLGGAITIIGGTASATGTVRADGGDGGDIEIDSLNGDITSSSGLNSSAGGSFGDGGTVTMIASNNLTVTGPVFLPGTGNPTDGGGDGGDVDLEGTAGTVSVSGVVDNHGASPDGDAGETDVTAGLDYIQNGTLTNNGAGGDGCGGFIDIEVGRNINLIGSTDMSGGFCGGDLIAFATNVSVGSASQFSADAAEIAGSFTAVAQDVSVAGKVHATSSASDGEAGIIQLTSCTIEVPNGAVIKTDGVTPGINLLQASGLMTIGGQFSSRPSGHNRFEYLDQSKPPNFQGSALIQPTRDCSSVPGCLNSSLAACAQSAVCGNGVKEGTEGCDDGNNAPCDGCSPACQPEVCGNGTIDCGEDCDDGAANGAPGDPCDATCHVVQGGNTIFVPSTHRGARGCWIEWAIQHAPISGLPPSSITCIDGDTCDADGADDGVCTFQASACLNVTDPRLPLCHPTSVETIKARRPSAARPSDQVESDNAQIFVGALDTLGPTVKSGDTVLHTRSPDSRADHCTAPFNLRVPHAPGSTGRRSLSAGVIDPLGDRTSNRITLSCLPNNAVCGNGVVEAGEQCDDGNTTCGDGCSSNCKIERCGNGIVDCNEDCDEGPNNGKLGDPCTAQCTEAPPANRIPGGSSSRDCPSEFSLAAGQLVTNRAGIPSTKQTCVEGDPTCDFDAIPGNCRFHLWLCLAGDDSRLGCTADAVGSVDVIQPNATKTGFSGAARDALVAVLGRMSFPVGPGELCSGRINVDVPAGRSKLVLKTQATTVDGIRDRDGLKLTCAPAGTVLK
jgi:cysteine-rich repeat protein